MLKLTQITEKARLLISLSLAFFLLLMLFLQSNGLVEGGQDSYNHFLISKFAFKYPHLLLDQWGKPIYTILAHPFNVISLSAGVWFNIGCVLLAGIFSALAAGKLGISNYWISFWLVIFTPISLGNTLSTLTEPLNMLFLSAGFYLWLSNKKVATVVLFSFLPWIRTEGFVMLVPFLVYLIWQKHYKLLPLLLSATLLFNLLGWWQTGEPFWFITNNPYFLVESEAERFSPGPGSFLYYIKANSTIFGNILGFIGCIGAVLIGYFYLLKNRTELRFSFWVICGIFVAYYFAHSFIMWKGMMGTHGMTRVMMVIVPCIAICFNFLISEVFNKIGSKSKPIALAAVVILIMANTFSSYKAVGYPTHFWNINKISVKQIDNFENLTRAHDLIEEKGWENRVIYHQIPIYNALYNKDPFAKPLSKEWKTENIWSIDHENNWAPKNSILLWDGYHAQREGNMLYSQIMEMNDYRLIQSFRLSDTAISDNDMLLFEKIR